MDFKTKFEKHFKLEPGAVIDSYEFTMILDDIIGPTNQHKLLKKMFCKWIKTNKGIEIEYGKDIKGLEFTP